MGSAHRGAEKPRKMKTFIVMMILSLGVIHCQRPGRRPTDLKCQLLDIDLTGWDILKDGIGDIFSWSECAALCTTNINPKCDSFTWESLYNKCWIKTGIPNQSTYKGAISGTAECLNPASNWVKVFSHDVAGGVFQSDDDALSKNPDDPTALLFSRLDQLEKFRTGDGKFHFKIVFPELGGSNEWIQTSNPATESRIEGFQPVQLDYDIDGYDQPWKGLGLCTGSQQALICDSPTEGRWWMCTGCQAVMSRRTLTIPGPKKRGETFKHVVTQVELYVKRI